MLAEKTAQAASELLDDLRREGRRVPHLPEWLRPRTRVEGYLVQGFIERRSRWPLFGWKIAATSEDGQRHLNVDTPLAGRLVQEMVFESGAELPFGNNHMKVAEAEFAFRMARSLEPRQSPYSPSEVLEAVDTLHPAIEIPNSRFDAYATVGKPQLIADNACAHQFILGPVSPSLWRSLCLADHPVTAAVNDQMIHDGSGANVLGDPIVALAWLVNELSDLNFILRAGQVVTTGTCVAPLSIQPCSKVVANFGSIGTVTMRFSAT